MLVMNEVDVVFFHEDVPNLSCPVIANGGQYSRLDRVPGYPIHILVMRVFFRALEGETGLGRFTEQSNGVVARSCGYKIVTGL